MTVKSFAKKTSVYLENLANLFNFFLVFSQVAFWLLSVRDEREPDFVFPKLTSTHELKSVNTGDVGQISNETVSSNDFTLGCNWP